MEGLWPSRTPVVLGHESSGVVEKVGPGVTSVKPGDRVVLVIRVLLRPVRPLPAGPAGPVHAHERRREAEPPDVR